MNYPLIPLDETTARVIIGLMLVARNEGLSAAWPFKEPEEVLTAIRARERELLRLIKERYPNINSSWINLDG